MSPVFACGHRDCNRTHQRLRLRRQLTLIKKSERSLSGGAKGCGLPAPIGELPCSCEWRHGNNRSADQIIPHGHYFGYGKKPVQPALKPRLVDVSSMARPILTIIAIGARERAQQSQLRVASWREVQCSQQTGKAFRASTGPQIDRWFPSVDIVTLLRLLITLLRFPALDASARRHRRRPPGVGIVPMPAHDIRGRSWTGRLRWSFVGGFRHQHNWLWGDQVASIRDVQSV